MKRFIYKDIIMTGSAGLSGSLFLADREPDRIRERFPKHIIRDMKETERTEGELQKEVFQIVSKTISKCDCRSENLYVREIGGRGVTAALWDMGEALVTGFSIYADKIPVSQLSVEICELFGEDPLKISSDGCFLICTQKENELCDSLSKQEVQAAIIGHTEETKGRVLVMGEISRYIDKPR